MCVDGSCSAALEYPPARALVLCLAWRREHGERDMRSALDTSGCNKKPSLGAIKFSAFVSSPLGRCAGGWRADPVIPGSVADSFYVIYPHFILSGFSGA